MFKIKEKIYCEACQDTCEINGDPCQECCEHYEHDHFICLDCGYEGEPSDYFDEDAGKDR